MKKLLLATLLSTSLVVSHAQDIIQTNITHTTLNQVDQEAADHWGLNTDEWLQYKKYMELEGKYFYEKLDPLNVMALMTQEPNARKRYIAKHLQFERTKVSNEIAFANDLWRVQRAMYGNEALLDFGSLPWMDDETFDRRTIKQTVSDITHEAQQIVSYSDPASIEYERKDELWIITDENCNNCGAQIKAIVTEQPLKVVVISMTKDLNKLKKWSNETGINEFLRQDKVRLEIFDPLLFNADITPKVNDLYHARSGHILRKL